MQFDKIYDRQFRKTMKLYHLQSFPRFLIIDLEEIIQNQREHHMLYRQTAISRAEYLKKLKSDKKEHTIADEDSEEEEYLDFSKDLYRRDFPLSTTFSLTRKVDAEIYEDASYDLHGTIMFCPMAHYVALSKIKRNKDDRELYLFNDLSVSIHIGNIENARILIYERVNLIRYTKEK
jgi:hypothetical protein